MEIPEKLREVLKHEGVVAIVTMGDDAPHVVNTWNSYVHVTADGRLALPAGRMRQTEMNLAAKPDLLVTLGAREVPGLHGPGAGFLIKGQGAFAESGREYDALKSRFPWLRAALIVSIRTVTQTL